MRPKWTECNDYDQNGPSTTKMDRIRPNREEWTD